MVNRTISLDTITDAIRAEIVEDGTSFSVWVRSQLRQHVPGEDEKPRKSPPKPRVQSMCKTCMTDNNTNGHLQLIDNKWAIVCPYGGKE